MASGVQVVRAKLQHITVEDYLPTLGITKAELMNWSPKSNKAAIAIEFSIAYRFGAHPAACL